MTNLIERQTLVDTLDACLDATAWKDYGPNGLQVEGRPSIRKIVTGVTASLALIEAALQAQADAIVVHHGLFWRGQDGRVAGWMKQRLQRLLCADVNLLAYHLPLDAHPTLGNNAQLAQVLGLEVLSTTPDRFGEQLLGRVFATQMPLQALVQQVTNRLERDPTWVGQPEREVRRVGVCTGAAQSYFESAIAAGVDVFITGEISEPQAHIARECGVAYIACGHHASERYGVRALGEWVAQRWGLSHEFIDLPNPA